jgi:hypothetical protein
MPASGPQPLGEDRRQEPLDRAVDEHVGRRLRLVSQLDRAAATLAGPDPGAGVVEGEPLLVVGGDDVLEIGTGERKPVRCQRGQEGVDVHPAGIAEREADAVRPVPENERQPLAHAGDVHGHEPPRQWVSRPARPR